jgi:hypothetical protein
VGGPCLVTIFGLPDSPFLAYPVVTFPVSVANFLSFFSLFPFLSAQYTAAAGKSRPEPPVSSYSATPVSKGTAFPGEIPPPPEVSLLGALHEGELKRKNK